MSSPFAACWAWRARSIATAEPGTSSTRDRKSTRLNSSHLGISYAVFCLKKKKQFWYRESQQTLASFHFLSAGQIAPFDPPPNDSGMIVLALDPQGLFFLIDAVPPKLKAIPQPFPLPN